MAPDAPIGVFDSGLGGLSIAREIRRRLPRESMVYLADSAYCPYGGRPLAEIRDRSLRVTAELVRRGAKLVVVACNTASGAALESLREVFDIPIVGLEPAVKPAAARSRTGTIGVLATAATLRTERFERLVQRHGNGVRVVAQACPGLVELVEAGQLEGEGVRAVLEPLLAPLREAEVDQVVLGCTHYPFLRAVISEALGPGVAVLDSGEAVARQVDVVLNSIGGRATGEPAEFLLLTTGEAAEVRRVAAALWEEPLEVEAVRF